MGIVHREVPLTQEGLHTDRHDLQDILLRGHPVKRADALAYREKVSILLDLRGGKGLVLLVQTEHIPMQARSIGRRGAHVGQRQITFGHIGIVDVKHCPVNELAHVVMDAGRSIGVHQQQGVQITFRVAVRVEGHGVRVERHGGLALCLRSGDFLPILHRVFVVILDGQGNCAQWRWLGRVHHIRGKDITQHEVTEEVHAGLLGARRFGLGFHLGREIHRSGDISHALVQRVAGFFPA
mmetsp:Transcript_32014/g.54701  ORF Transcript_32014/g.54701 Transcript_32014/m.54701 type:complete len:238 (+) Transcript_32014:2237-2950(+)